MEIEQITLTSPTVAESETVQIESPLPISDQAVAAEPVEPSPVASESSKEKVITAPEAPTHAPSLLSQAVSEETSIEAVPEEKTQEPIVEEAKRPEPITYEEFKFPEGVSVDKNQVEEFVKTIGEFGVHQEAAQKLMDMYANEAKSLVERTVASQWDVFNNQQSQWVNEVMSHDVLGGAGHETAMNKVAQARDVVFKNNTDKIKQFNDIMNVTGAGNHPIVLEFMHEVHKYVRPGEILNTTIKPPPDIGTKPMTRAERMYGSSKT